MPASNPCRPAPDEIAEIVRETAALSRSIRDAADRLLERTCELRQLADDLLNGVRTR